MFGGNRLVFNYIALKNKTGLPMFILADLVSSMEIVSVTAEVPSETPGEKPVKREFIMTRILNPFGQEYLVFDKPDEIVRQIQAASNDALRAMTAGQQIIQVPPGTSLKKGR